MLLKLFTKNNKLREIFFKRYDGEAVRLIYLLYTLQKYDADLIWND